MRLRFPAVRILVSLVVTIVGCGGMAKMASAPEAPGMAADGAYGAKGMEDEATPAVTTWKRSQLASHTVRLSVGDDHDLPIQGMQAQVRIDGFRARVVLDYLFANDRGGGLEGRFQMRLPNEASPYYLAFGELAQRPAQIAVSEPVFFNTDQVRRMGTEPLQIAADRAESWVSPKQARMVPKEKAAFAYTSTVQRRVDPALMEWAGAGIFNARVFPLDAGKLYRIVVGYDVSLTPTGDELTYEFDVPPGIPEKAVDIGVADLPGSKTVFTPNASLTSEAGRKFARFDRPSASTISVRISGVKSSVLVGADPATGPYFASSFRPSLPKGADAAASRQAVFVVDTSLSSNPDRFNIWLKLMRATLDRNRGTMNAYAVLFFGIDTHWWKPGFVNNTPESVNELMTYASGLALEGATDLGVALEEATTPRWQAVRDKPAPSDLFLFSDGASTWGEADTQALARSLQESGAPLFAYQTGLTGTDTEALTLLARESGGAVFSVVGEAEIKAAAVAHRTRPFHLVGVELDGASDVLLAGRPRAIYPGQTLSLAGRGTIPTDAEVRLTVKRDGKTEIVRTQLGQALESELTSRTYGQIAVGQLEELGDATEDVAKSYATHFRVTGRTCSLLMLESEEDYRRFGIRPEADAFVVKQKPVSQTVEAVLRQLSATLGEPKASMLAWLAKLERTPGMTFRTPVSLRAAVESMPASSFAVRVPPLAVKQRNRRQLSASYAGLLARHAIEYDVVQAEAGRRAKQVGAADGLKALSSLVEQNPGDAVLARDIGYAAMQFGLPEQAYYLFRRVAASRPYEPQNYRAMAQSLAAIGRADLAMIWFEVGLVGQYDERFGEFRRILAMDYLRFLRGIENGSVKSSVPDYAKSRLASLAREYPMPTAELVVMITWNTDATDVDLHVIEPTGEDCHYANRNTEIGGAMTTDVTQGYGPEMYVLPRAKEGRYVLRAHYYASDSSRTATRTKVYATVFENWGTPRERTYERVVTLEVGKEVHEIMTITKGRGALQIAR
jgi:von Willebrand factor type A domain